MKTKKVKKLHLTRETVRALADYDLRQANGGVTFLFCGIFTYISGLNSCSVVNCTQHTACELCYV